ncbi:NAD(+) diphosphatase [Sphingomonas sp. LB-2]|uniref:NAD(+) diphosphatase n=1 Tax=Sphingomonas caeni TaxID=2984949 RepID=UPI00222EF419|nr:NAD(+) diphosphatase [Sphingomonas caeni]MCW3847047.1 NAD(+) diphosphatase [Sphingomonas caeni]
MAAQGRSQPGAGCRSAQVRPGFTGGTLDRADPLRTDVEKLAAAMADPRARLLRLRELVPELGDDGRLIWDSIAEAPVGGEIVLLGFDPDGVPHFAAANPAETPVARPAFTMFRLLDQLTYEDAAHFAAARSTVDWHMRHRFCAVCGTGTELFRAGWGRKCPHCNAEHFPRVDPVVIMLAEYGAKGERRVLLGRGPGWPPGRYSALAGFVEPGESLEEAVAREIFEEAGVRVRNVRYVASQPWPFPSSLMVAAIGEADDDRLTIDTNELEDAIWVTRDEARAVMSGGEGPFVAPPHYALAHTLLSAWIAEA